MQAKGKFSRRGFIALMGLASAGTALAACSQQAPAATPAAAPAGTAAPAAAATAAPAAAATAAPAAAATTAPAAAATAAPAAAAGKGLTTPQGRELPADAAPLDKQIFYAYRAEPKHFDCARDMYNAAGMNLITEPLLRRDENMQIVPCMAESYKAGPNAEYWDFVIRKGTVWSDGSPITADDWVFTFKHIADPRLDNPWSWFYYDIKGVQAVKEKGASPDTIGVEAIDAQTVRIHGQNGPIPQLPGLMAYQGAVPVPKALAEKDPEHWADTPEKVLSSGPFIVSKWDHNKRIEYNINPKYTGLYKPGIQKWVETLAPDTTVWFTPWMNKELDLYYPLKPAELTQTQNDPKLKDLIHSFNNFQTEYLQLDTLKAPLDNLKLRQALAHAIDRETLCTKVENGTYAPGYSMLPPGFPAYNADLKPLQAFDVAQAKQLMADAGYKDGKDSSGQQLTLNVFAQNQANDATKLQYVQTQWQNNLGIKVNLQVVENAVWQSKRAEHSMQIYLGPYEYDYLDPSNMLTSLWRSTSDKGSPRHGWKSAEFDKLVSDAGKEADDAKRMQMYRDAEKILCEQIGGIFLQHGVFNQIWWPYLVGMKPNKEGNVVYRWLDIARYQMYIRNDVDQYRKTH